MRALVDVLAAGVTNSSGSVVASGTVTFYESGTTTLTTAYQDYEGTTPHSNPATLDAAGRLVAWVDDRVKLVIADSTGATVRTIDGVNISDSSISASIATESAGNALSANGNELDVNVDDETITISSDSLSVKDDGLTAKKFNDKGFLVHPGATWNVGLEAATTTNASDSIQITSLSGAALAASTNIAHVLLPTTTAGTCQTFEFTADVKINLTGAHWALGTLGDFTDIPLRVYAINDNGTLRWGVSLLGGLNSIASTATSATATNINLKAEMLVDTALTSGTWPCAQVGWFYANFDDTGGAAEDLWVVQTGVGDLNVGIPFPDTTEWTTFTPTGSWSSNVTYTGSYRRFNGDLEVQFNCSCSGAPTSATFTLNMPTGIKIDQNQILNSTQQTVLGNGFVIDSGSATYPATILHVDASSVAVIVFIASSNHAQNAGVTQAVPFTFGAADGVLGYFRTPVANWSAN